MQIAVLPIFQNLREFWVTQFSAWNLFNSISDVAQNNKTIKLSGLLFEHCELCEGVNCRAICPKSSLLQSTVPRCFVLCLAQLSKALYMPFDRFLLAVESLDLSQADKILIRVSSFPKLSDGYFWMIKFAVIPKKAIWHLAIWQNWCFGQFYHSKICKIEK